ncbi:MAG: histidine kinase dimerization/phospho-acceptor domain-containing protein, partial [Nitrospinota bacterium]
MKLLLHKISLISGSVSFILGIVVLLGWHTHSPALIQVHPSFVPMQYNTALGFLFCGIGLVAANFSGFDVKRIAGLFLILLGGLTLIQYIFNIDVGIDQLLMKHYIEVKTSHPGRMAPNTALCFSLFGLTLSIANKPEELAKKSIVIGILGGLVLALGAVAFGGYVLVLETAYGWGNLTRMAVHTAFGFMALGLGIIAFSWKVDQSSENQAPGWTPILVAIASITTTFLLWQAEIVNLKKQINNKLEIKAGHIRDQILLELNTGIQGLTHLVKLWEAEEKPAKDDWIADTTLSFQHNPMMRTIKWLDPSYRAIWVALQKGQENIFEKDLSSFKDLSPSLNKARDKRQVLVKSQINLTLSGRALLIFMPVFHGIDFNGFILGIFNYEDFLTKVMKNVDEDLSVELVDGSLSENQNSFLNIGKNRSFSLSFEFFENHMRLLVNPGPGWQKLNKSFLPMAILIIGFLMTFFLSMLLHFAIKYKGAVLKTETVNKMLEKKIEERQLADLALRKMAEKLEHRVTERTKELSNEVDERRKTEVELKKLSQALMQSPVSVIITDPEGVIEYINPKFIQTTGFNLNDVAGKTPRILKSKKHSADFYKELWDTILAGNEWSGEICNKKKNGEEYWERALISPILLSNGRISNFIGLLEDISERKKTEATLKNRVSELGEARRSMLNMMEDLEEAKKTAEAATRTKSEFLARMSHEIRTPMNAIIGMSQLALMTDPTPKQQDYLNKIDSSSHNLLGIINDILDFSRIEAGKLEIE